MVKPRKQFLLSNWIAYGDIPIMETWFQVDAISEGNNDLFGTKKAHHLKLKDYHAILTDCQIK
jgi:hypothetical protein